MAKPRIFISSTYYDLKHIRSNIEFFIENMGYEAVLSEKGAIAYNPDNPLDESCYKEAQNSNIFVLIIGGRYGSAISDQKGKVSDSFYERYESVTKNEFEAANKKDIPCYILVEKSVFSEYETFKRNRKNEDIEYAHVDSVNIFHFLDHVIKLPKNNPIHQFEKHQEIEIWLKAQWAGLFRELILDKSQHKEIKSLTSQVDTLSNLNKTLKNYLEDIISKISKDGDGGATIIKKEQERIEEYNLLRKFEDFSLINALKTFDIDSITAMEIWKKSKSLSDLTKNLEKETNGELIAENVLNHWEKHAELKNQVNEISELLGLKKLK